MAVGLLDKCYKEEDDLTSQLLTYDLVYWSHWTCLTLAVSANLKDFLSHAACQLLINDLWMGGMKIRKHVIPKIIMALLFPPALFAIQFKSAKELQYMPQTQEEHEQDLEDQESDSDSESEREHDENDTDSSRINREQLLYQRFGELFTNNNNKNTGENNANNINAKTAAISGREDSDRLIQTNFINSEHSLVSILVYCGKHRVTRVVVIETKR